MGVQAPRRLFTVNEFRRMAEAAIFREDDRVELISGEIVEMTPIGSRHAACVSRLNHMLGPHVGGKAILRVQDPLRLDDYSELQPDISIARARDVSIATPIQSRPMCCSSSRWLTRLPRSIGP
jgi:Uma2 family endonuclease